MWGNVEQRERGFPSTGHLIERLAAVCQGELDFDEFRKAVRRHGRMSVRSITDGELKEVFAIVDKDCGGTVSGDEFDLFLSDPDSGVSLKPQLTKDYSKAASSIGAGACLPHKH